MKENSLKETKEYQCKLLSLPLIKEVYLKEPEEATKRK